MSTDLAAFLHARITEDEKVAQAAQSNHPDSIASVGQAPDTGEHWQWVYTGGYRGHSGDGVTDEPVDLAGCAELEFVDEGGNGSPSSLRSVEEYPPWWQELRPLPRFILGEVQELRPGVATHIARHDPARVLADCAAKHAIVKWATANPLSCGDIHPGADIYHFDGHDHPVLLALAQPWADHPDYQPAWTAT